MTIPMEYQRATAEFDGFLVEARDALDFAARNTTYTTVQAVLLAFRRSLRPEQVPAFAAVLPPMLRAIFVAEWTPGEYVETFPDLPTLTHEIKHLRPNHNLSPDNALMVVAKALRHQIDIGAFDRVLSTMPEGSTSSGRPHSSHYPGA